MELRKLQGGVAIPGDEITGDTKRPHNGSDGDSGVLVTVDEEDEARRSAVNTPSSGENAQSAELEEDVMEP